MKSLKKKTKKQREKALESSLQKPFKTWERTSLFSRGSVSVLKDTEAKRGFFSVKSFKENF